MTPAELLRRCAERGLTVSVSEDRTKLRIVPTQKLDPDLRAALVAHKPVLLQLLAGPPLAADGLPAEHCRACGSPNWWTSAARPGWHCSYCDERPEPFTQGRVVVIAAGAWGRH
jgi:hypothetical protein